MEQPTLEITEKWIRHRVGLNHENLEDVKSLSLPGTYHEKITHLGTSLLGFTRLRSLDLSRNGIVSLSGLVHLTTLERLNLYYNNVQTLKEIHSLRHNSSLQELDLRLNPVTKKEVDYRLFVIHLLPNLRQLDDRSVRDGERNSAIQRFDTDQATEMMSRATDDDRSNETATTNHSARAEQIRKLAKYPSALEDDDNDLIDLLAKTGGDLSKPYPLSGSGVKSSSYQPHPKEDAKANRPTILDAGTATVHNTVERGTMSPVPEYNGPETPSRQFRGQVHFQENGSATEEDLSKFKDEAEAFTSYTTKGYFTPNPNADTGMNIARTPTSQPPQENYKEPPHVQRIFEQQTQNKQESRSPLVRDAADELLTSLLHIVDRYWNGSKSLHYHSKFQAQARHLIKTAFLQSLASHKGRSPRESEEVVERLEAENQELKGEIERRSSKSHLHRELEAGLKNTQEEVHILQGKLQESMEKNSQLQQELMRAREPDSVMRPMDDRDIGREVECLQRENEKLTFQIKHFKQSQELANMLQESHKSLVTTNDHLLKEMDELKKRHLQEVKQLHWSYKEMKNTMKVISHNSDQNHNPI